MTSPSPSTPVRSPRRPSAISLITTRSVWLSASSTVRRPTTALGTSRRVPPPSPMPSSPSITTTPSTTTITMPSRRPISSRPALGRSRRTRMVLHISRRMISSPAMFSTTTPTTTLASRAAPSSCVRPRHRRATSRATPSASRRLWKALMSMPYAPITSLRFPSRSIAPTSSSPRRPRTVLTALRAYLSR